MANVPINPAVQTSSTSTVRSDVIRDDRIFPVVRWIGFVIVLVLVAAFTILYLMPGRVANEPLFSWKISPTMTPMMMGAGYISGGWFFLRLFFSTRFHHVGWGFLAITTFVWFMGLSTFLHFDKFAPYSSLPFYAWLLLYVVTPFLVPYLWYRNRVTDPGTPDPDDVVVSQTIRTVSMFVGIVLLAIALFMFVFPTPFVAIANKGGGLWPWALTPLTARVIAGWFALPGVVGVALSRDSRWSSWRIMIESQMIALVLILLAVARAWREFNQASPLTWGFIAGIALLLVGATALYVSMESRRRRIPAAQTA